MEPAVSTATPSRLPPPLRVQSDMASTWRDVDLDFDTAAEALVSTHRADGEARDLPVLDLRTWTVSARDGHFTLVPLAKHHPPLALRRTAFAHLAARLGAPAEFVRDKLTAPLQAATMNYLLAQQDRPVSTTLRLRGDEVTALVSERYAALDPEELVDGVRTALVQHGMLGDVRVRAVATGLVDAIRLVFRSETVEPKVGDTSALGIDISTSSFGRSALHLRGMLWRLVCSNGLRIPESMGAASFRHVGDPARLRDGLGEALPTVMLHANGTMNRWRDAVGVFVTDVAEEVERLIDLTHGERGLVRDAITAEVRASALPERTDLYSFINGVTSAAQQAEPERRLELEAVAGRLLHREWAS